MGVRPRLADVKLHAVQFQPGDRIIVDVYQQVSEEQMKKIKKTVEKWAGDVEVLVVNRNLFSVEVVRGDQNTIICP
jgi:aspartate 1-decarboxylase